MRWAVVRCMMPGMEPARKRMTGDEFLEWCLDQEGRWELVGGEPVLMMSGTNSRHDQITVNLIVALDRSLDGGPCRPTTHDVASRMVAGNIRRPDVTVDCGVSEPTALTTTEPTVFFEVMSPSNRPLDTVTKPDEYRQLTSLKHFVLIDPGRPRVRLFTRTEGGWVDRDIIGLDSTVPLDGIGVELTFAEIYRRVEFDA